ncbi:Hypothetical predicted protein [Marmota monax]|uniref:Uncharacterized protein n=1 Tax=Marmota monax TaxID=9995 RepID=A0A5E4ACC0_MARMO|nr:hypothetical protein GHT09_007740 [Marmota monax]VTJ54953.1 Hypothetical predicted protein [Marmota monax]
MFSGIFTDKWPVLLPRHQPHAHTHPRGPPLLSAEMQALVQLTQQPMPTHGSLGSQPACGSPATMLTALTHPCHHLWVPATESKMHLLGHATVRVSRQPQYAPLGDLTALQAHKHPCPHTPTTDPFSQPSHDTFLAPTETCCSYRGTVPSQLHTFVPQGHPFRSTPFSKFSPIQIFSDLQLGTQTLDTRGLSPAPTTHARTHSPYSVVKVPIRPWKGARCPSRVQVPTPSARKEARPDLFVA